MRSYKILAFTSALGVVAVLGGIIVTLANGILQDPGGGITVALQHVAQQKMFPTSLAAAFGGSFGTVAFLFCVNFLTFPIMNSMTDQKQFGGAVTNAVFGTAFFNIIFAALCVGFYGDQTQDLVLGNLGNGPYLSALKLLLCIDLLFTFPIVFSSGRQIAENALISTDFGSNKIVNMLDVVELTPLTTFDDEDDDNDDDNDQQTFKMNQNLSEQSPLLLSVARGAIAAGGVLICFSLAQIGGFGTVANLVGGVAQGTLAFIIPPLVAVTLARRGESVLDRGGEPGQLILGLFGVCVVALTSYFTIIGNIIT